MKNFFIALIAAACMQDTLNTACYIGCRNDEYDSGFWHAASKECWCVTKKKFTHISEQKIKIIPSPPHTEEIKFHE